MKFYQNLYHHTSNAEFSISHRLYVIINNLQDADIDNVLFWINHVEKCTYTIVSAVRRQQRKSDVMTYFGHSARSAVYYKAGSSLPVIRYAN
jgi:hypothetical protein